VHRVSSAASLRSQDCPFGGAELSFLDPRWLQDVPQRPCCQCHLGPRPACGPVHLIPSLCCDESCSLGRSPFQSLASLGDGSAHHHEDSVPLQPGGHSEAGGARGASEPAESDAGGPEGEGHGDHQEDGCESRGNLTKL
uniref:Uncharacterized protein n=1 Tax=Gasterosteus aculeatus TaxID=69293 RepID=G3NUT5_GASAC